MSLQAIFLNIVSNSFIKNYTSIMNGEMKTDIFKDTEIEEIVKELKIFHLFQSSPFWKDWI